MADIPAGQFQREHDETYSVFRRIVFFAIMHISFTVVCLAVASLGHTPLFAAMAWIGGTLAMLTLYVLRTT